MPVASTIGQRGRSAGDADPGARPTPADLRAAQGRGIPDVLAPGLTLVFCGINPGLYSAATGYHFARPGNRFWPALHRGGFTPHLLAPSQQASLPGYRLGITNLVARATASAEELDPDELREGARALMLKVRRRRPGWVAVLGVTAYRSAFHRPRATVGPQSVPIAGSRVWVLPNPSGLNAHYTLDDLAAEFTRLRVAAVPGAADLGPDPRWAYPDLFR
jgi:TDG/mug DNA glycosylase family protein